VARFLKQGNGGYLAAARKRVASRHPQARRA
jgi:hypothetical protein